ncbi:MAG: methyltransferase domain-containing protein [Anaerolineae bacterium]|nr:methyltransferase domain-containing protein [Anaerolineae bacterium]
MHGLDEISGTNQQHWEKAVEDGAGCTIPYLDLEPHLVREYAAGQLQDPPEHLLGMTPVYLLAGAEGKDVLCLACGGGQQSAVFGLLGAHVTVVDLAEGQLKGDRRAAAHYGYKATTIQGDMRDLSVLAQASFDLVWQDNSMAWIPDCRQVYSQVHRVLRPGGRYKVNFTNPAVEFVHEEWDGIGYRIVRPYSERTRLLEGAMEFRHYLKDIFGGLIDLGFSIEHVNDDPPAPPEEPPSPGSWAHIQHYLVGFEIVAVRN